MNKYIFFLASLLLMTACQSLPVDTSAFEEAPLYGVIYDGTSLGVQGFSITIDEGITIQSDLNGRFSFDKIKKGKHVIKAQKKEYQAVELTFDFINRAQVLYITSFSVRDYIASSELALKKSDYIKSRTAINEALKLSPDNPVALYLLAVLEQSLHNYTESFSVLKKLLASGVNEVPIYLLLLDIAQEEPSIKEEVISIITSIKYLVDNPQIKQKLLGLGIVEGVKNEKN